MVQYNEHRHHFILTASICIPIASVAIILRFIARYNRRQNYFAEEWFAVASLITFLVYNALCLYEGEHGSGYDPRKLPYPVLVTYLKIVTVSGIMVALSIGAAKFSILFLYMRVFSVDDKFHRAIKIVAIIHTLWLIGTILALVLYCSPVEKAWQPSPLVKGHCFSYAKLTVALEVPNALMDFVIMALPMSMLRKLRIPLQDKIALAFIFFLGGMVGIIGFIRIAILYNPGNFNKSATGIWVDIQLVMAIVCCCFPTYRPLLKYMSVFESIKSRYRSYAKSRSIRPSNNGNHDSISNRYYLKDVGQEGRVLTRIEGNVSRDNQAHEGKDYSQKVVDIQRTVEMV